MTGMAALPPIVWPQCHKLGHWYLKTSVVTLSSTGIVLFTFKEVKVNWLTTSGIFLLSGKYLLFFLCNMKSMIYCKFFHLFWKVSFYYDRLSYIYVIDNKYKFILPCYIHHFKFFADLATVEILQVVLQCEIKSHDNKIAKELVVLVLFQKNFTRQ